MSRKDHAGLFKKGDPRINRKGRPKHQDVFKKLRATFELPTEELPPALRAFVDRLIGRFGFNGEDRPRTLGDCMIMQFANLMFEGKEETSAKMISTIIDKTAPTKFDVTVEEKGALENKMASLSIEKLEKISEIINCDEDEDEDEDEDCYDEEEKE